MKRFFIILFATLAAGLSMSAQMIPENLLIYKAKIYYEDQDGIHKLSKEEIEDLSVYGFNSEKYFQIRRMVVAEDVLLGAGIAMYVVGGCLESTKHKDISIGMKGSGLMLGVLALIPIIFYDDTDEIVKLLDGVQHSSRIGPSQQGLGIAWTF